MGVYDTFLDGTHAAQVKVYPNAALRGFTIGTTVPPLPGEAPPTTYSVALAHEETGYYANIHARSFIGISSEPKFLPVIDKWGDVQAGGG